MNKSSIVAIFLGLVACAGVAVCATQLKQISTTLASLDERMGKMDGATGSAAPTSGTTAGTSTPTTIADVSQEVSKLKAELAAVKSSQETLDAKVATAAPAKVGGTDKPLARLDDAEVTAAVEAVLAKKDAEAKEAEKKRQAEMMARGTQMMVDNLAKELGLTEQQKTKVGEIVVAQAAVMRDMWTNRKEGDDPRAKMGELKTETDTQIKAVLTTEQGVKYDELSKNMMGMMGGGFGGGRRSGGGGSGENR